jgi:hypothetical protein
MAASGQLTVEGVVTVLFHAALLAAAVARHGGKPAREVTDGDLRAAGAAVSTVDDLARQEPHLASYIASNVEEATGALNAGAARDLLAQISAALAG